MCEFSVHDVKIRETNKIVIMTIIVTNAVLTTGGIMNLPT